MRQDKDAVRMEMRWMRMRVDAFRWSKMRIRMRFKSNAHPHPWLRQIRKSGMDLLKLHLQVKVTCHHVKQKQTSKLVTELNSKFPAWWLYCITYY